MTAIETFSLRHTRTHARVDGLTDGLTEAQVREAVHPAVNPLAWLLWHMARREDAAVNALVADRPQVLDDGWLPRLRLARRDIGTGMTPAEVRDLAACVDLPGLQRYWTAVGERTADVVAGLSPAGLDTVVGPERIRRAVVDRGLVAGAAATQLQQAWSGMTAGYFLIYLALTHNYEHIGQADLVRGMLGRPGPRLVLCESTLERGGFAPALEPDHSPTAPPPRKADGRHAPRGGIGGVFPDPPRKI